MATRKPVEVELTPQEQLLFGDTDEYPAVSVKNVDNAPFSVGGTLLYGGESRRIHPKLAEQLQDNLGERMETDLEITAPKAEPNKAVEKAVDHPSPNGKEIETNKDSTPKGSTPKPTKN